MDPPAVLFRSLFDALLFAFEATAEDLEAPILLALSPVATFDLATEDLLVTLEPPPVLELAFETIIDEPALLFATVDPALLPATVDPVLLPPTDDPIWLPAADEAPPPSTDEPPALLVEIEDPP